jgi:predicted phosphodiesterase
MRLIVTADLHYNIARSKAPTMAVAEEICQRRADGLLILGDIGGRDIGIVSECLHLFDRFPGRKFFVAGNHDIWTDPEGDSLVRLERELPAVCREAGFHPLDIEPAELDGIGLAGSIGWYDYTFRPGRLGIPLRFYQQKIAPGAAARTPGHEHLMEDTSDIPEDAMRIGARWMDGVHARLPISDEAFCDRLLNRLDNHLDQLSECRSIVAGIHHLPFRQLVPQQENPSWAFAAAFLGSERFGELLARHDRVRYVLCGHSHMQSRVRRDHIECINVGCTYKAKRYETIDIH